MVNTVSISIRGNPAQGYTASCNNQEITPDGNNWLVFQIVTGGWSFVTGTTPPSDRPTYRSPKPPTPQPACGIWVDDPHLDFTCVRYTAQSVTLHDSNADKDVKPLHEYVVLMTNGSATVELDPMIRDRGSSSLAQ